MKDNIDDISKFALKISSDESKMAEVKKFIYLLSFISLHIKDKNIFEIIKNKKVNPSVPARVELARYKNTHFFVFRPKLKVLLQKYFCAFFNTSEPMG